MKIRSHLWGILATALCVAGCGLSSGPLPEDPLVQDFKIGFLSDFPIDAPGNHSYRTLRMLVDDAAAEGGVLVGTERFPISVHPIHVRSPESAAAAAQSLILQEEVDVVLGPNWSSNAIPSADVAEKYDIPMITPGSTHAETTSEKEWIFRVAFTDPLQGKVMARFAYEELDVRNIAIFLEVTNVYSRSLAQIFRENFEQLGGRIVADESYLTREENFTQRLAFLQDLEEVDAIFLPNFSDALVQQAQALQELGIDLPKIGSDIWGPWTLRGKPAFDGSYFTHHWHPSRAIEDSQSADLITRYRQAWGEDPDNMAALTYDAVGLLFDALRRCETPGPRELRDALAAVQDFQGATGTISFSGSGDPLKSVMILRIEGAEIVFDRLAAP